MMASISMIFQSNPPEIPNLLFFYQEWTLLLLNLVIITINYVITPLNKYYQQILDYINSL